MDARKITLVLRGDNETALADALSEATRLLNAGYLSGTNSNEESAFYFDSISDVPDEELPR